VIAAVSAVIARFDQGLRSRTAPLLTGLTTGFLFYWLLGSFAPEPWVYDEAAYLLQAKIFATGHWAVAGPPLPEFFEQVHVLVTPSLVPKYPPGHALLLVSGIWLGLPGLVPLLWSAITGALVFAFARALTNGWVALLGWLIWITAPVELYIRPSYLSQTSTTLIWLLAWGCLSRWRSEGTESPRRRRPWLIALAALVALGVVTRPITTAALALPVVVVILREVARRRAWRTLVPAVAVAVPIVGIAPIWSWATTGRAYPTPYSEYSRVYTPWNIPGFTIDRSSPLRAEVPAISRFRAEGLPVHERHTISRLPIIAWERLRGIAITFWGDSPPARWSLRWLLALAALVGLFALPGPLTVALWGGGALFVAMLSLASRPLWTVYYLELSPALALVTAIGTWRVVSAVANRVGRPGLAAGLVVLGVVAAAPGTTERLIRSRQQQIDLRTVPTELTTAIDSIPGRAIVFVESGPAHRPYESYVRNQPDWATARVWVVQDRGEDNRRLMAIAPDRTPYRFDPGSGALRPGATP
jgi:4-amino-4-deoxy-L-arabinose transferase-like glycosyltransferase